MELAKKYYNVHVTAFDLDSRAPGLDGDNAIPNVTFIAPVDFQQPNWPFNRQSFDLIRMSQLCGSVSDWWSLYRTAVGYVRLALCW